MGGAPTNKVAVLHEWFWNQAGVELSKMASAAEKRVAESQKEAEQVRQKGKLVEVVVWFGLTQI